MDIQKKTIQKKIKEYTILEKYFGVDKKNNIVYDEHKDGKMAIKNSEEDKEYTTYDSFVEWVDNKSKKELTKDLAQIEEDIEKEKKHISKVTPSDEQQSIIDCVTHGKNVSVDAVAGSGKTTTVLFIALNNKKKKILQITYNKQLKIEVREKAESYEIDNLEIHTYHSLAVKNYDKDAHTDDKIIKVLSENKPPRHRKKYDIIIIDEVQDMTPNYYFLVCKFISDMNINNATIVILGDRYQGIYEFKNADSRFLTLSNQIWENKNEFVNLPMQESYRVTSNIGQFVNKVMLGSDRIVANKKSKYAVQYYKKNKFMIHTIFANKIMEYLKLGYKPSDIFVLSPSIKSTNNPVKKLENKLVDADIPVYFARSDEDGLDENVIKGKVAFTTFHQAKGRERKIVFVFGFDDSYFKYHAKDKDPTLCPPELYVAVTRASEILIVLEGSDAKMLPFLQYSYYQLKSNIFINFIGDTPKKDDKHEKPEVDPVECHKISVKELTSYISEENNEKLIDLLGMIYEVECEPRTKYTSDIPCNIKTVDGKTEDVSDINGISIPAIYQHKREKKCTLEQLIAKMYENADNSNRKFIDKVYAKIVKDIENKPISSFLYMGNLYIALTENIHSKLNQIDTYDWLTKELVDKCHKNLKRNIGSTIQYEVEIGNEIDKNGRYYKYKSNLYGEIEIYGRVDAFDEDVLWEFKCVSSLQNEHLLQLVVYAWIWEKCMKEKHGSKQYKILNIRTGEVRVMKYENYIIEDIMSILFENKYQKKLKQDDKTFVEKCKIIKDKIKTSDKPIEKSLFQIFEKNSKQSKTIIEDIDFDDGAEDDEPVKMNINMFFKKKN
jgi:hypothetical protein